MIQPIKHFAINWVDGMKVSQRHLNDQDNFLIDTIRDSNSLGITTYNYGLLPISNEFTDRTITLVDGEIHKDGLKKQIFEASKCKYNITTSKTKRQS